MHNRIRKTIRNVFIVLCAISLLYILFSPAFHIFSGFLSKTERVKANTLLIEGWLENKSLELAYEEYKSNHYDYIVTTGNILPDHYFLDQNGYLIFNLSRFDTLPQQNRIHHIGITAYSSLRGKNAAHFNLWVNDSIVRGFRTTKYQKLYKVEWEGSLNDLDSVMVQFDNDKSAYGDRNLFVTGLMIDNTFLKPYTTEAAYDIARLDGQRREDKNSDSYAGQARMKLINLGMDPVRIISVRGYRTCFNKTFHSVVAFRDWIQNSGYPIKGINIVSLGDHSRRTWLTYRKVLGDKQPVGVISLPDPYHRFPDVAGVIYVAKQVTAYIYYKFILLPLQSVIDQEEYHY